ncbi:MAG: 4Fe-4S binding protein [Desulfobacterales bacterium]|nr:MAG: 4Fe-4S binding protein [Desulfobacterales bacterium]
MRTVKFFAQVDEQKCTGCGTCQIVCPTEAVKVIKKKAVVDVEKCLSCPNCSDSCPESAIALIRRSVPKKLYVDPSEVDQNEIRQLCLKAKLHPHQWGCMCNATRVREVAAAVLKGAKTLEEIALMTGIRSGCTAYCVQHMLRLLKANGVAVKEPKGHRWYDSTQTIWDLPQKVQQKHPGHFFEEDKKVFRKF